MRTSTLLARNLAWYWRTNLAVLLGVATATAILGGALAVGDSVRASLRRLALERLGNAEFAVTRPGFFREELAASLPGAAPLIALEAVATHEPGRRSAAGVEVYGVDERFWRFQQFPGEPPRANQALITPALAAELAAKPGDGILLRIPKPSAIPLESLHGQKENTGRSVRFTVAGVSAREFALRPQQGEVRAAYVPLARLERDLAQPRKVNLIVAAKLPGIERTLREHCTLADLGLRLRFLEAHATLSLESDSALLGDALAATAAATAQRMGLRAQPVLTYLANSIRVGTRETPYSLVAALDSGVAPASDDGIVLNQWAARDLGAKAGDPLELDYYVWLRDGRLHTETARFRVERIVPLDGSAADRDLTPEYPGITEVRSLRDWDPPFPLSLSRIRPIDEQYWERYGATPKAFIRLARGRALWGTRYGSLTSLRISPPSPAYEGALRAALDPAAMGLTAIPVQARALEAARGATDFGEYFVYFSFFLVLSALLLTGLFFRLGVEQRLKEIGLLRALGFSAAKIRRLFLWEGAVLAVAGAAAGSAGAAAYAGLILLGLRTWWFDAVGTRALALDAYAGTLATGAAAGVVAGLAAVLWTLGGQQPVTPRGLLAGAVRPVRARRRTWAGAAAGSAALALAAAGWAGKLDQASGFFGAGSLLLASALLFGSAWLHARPARPVRSVVQLGLRSAAHRPGRTILSIALIACATFLIVSLDCFRRDESPAGTGGFSLVAESVLPLIHDPNDPAGMAALNLPPLGGVRFVPFRLRPGDDASCLNLYQPSTPRILAAPASFLDEARFAFDAPAGSRNPWLLLREKLEGGAIPAIADANSLAYVLHRKLGEEFDAGGMRVRIVASLRDSLFQGELIVAEDNFLRAFPAVEGYRFFLIDASPPAAGGVTRELEDALSDYGFRVQPAAARLAAFHRVENSYLDTFRALGGLGLILGTVGLAAVLLRNALERRRELAMLRAAGYTARHLAVMVLAENVFLLAAGVVTGTLCAAVAVLPVVAARGGRFPVGSAAALAALVLVTGIAASLAATALALRSSILEALRSE